MVFLDYYDNSVNQIKCGEIFYPFPTYNNSAADNFEYI